MAFSRKKIVLLFLVPVMLSFVLHFHVFDLDLVGYHVWRQTQTQTVIYNFTFSDNSIFNPQRFDQGSGSGSLLYEFPLYQWLVAQVNNFVGYSVSNTRLITFFIFVFFLLGFYQLVRKFVSDRVSLLAHTCICFSPLLYYYCVNPLPDILALCFSVWCLKFFFDFLFTGLLLKFILFSLMMSLAALVKLPFLLFGSGYFLYLYYQLNAKNIPKVALTVFIWLLSIVPVILWYLIAIPTWKTNPVAFGISTNNKSFYQLLDYFQSNLISSMPELVTNYGACAFLFLGFYLFFKSKKWKTHHVKYFVVCFLICSAYFFYTLNLIERTHDYYLLPFVPFVFLVVTSGINAMLYSHRKFTYFLICIIPLLAWLRIDHRWNIEEPGFNKAYLRHQVELRAIIDPAAKCVIDFDDSKYIALYYLRRRGYSLYQNELNPELLKSLYLKGATYLITENKEFHPEHYDGLVLELLFDNGLKIYKLTGNHREITSLLN